MLYEKIILKRGEQKEEWHLLRFSKEEQSQFFLPVGPGRIFSLKPHIDLWLRENVSHTNDELFWWNYSRDAIYFQDEADMIQFRLTFL